MAVSVPASPFVSSFFNAEPDQSKLFPDDSVSIDLYTTFGEDDSTKTSFGSWPGDPYSCSEVSSFPPSDDSFTEPRESQLVMLLSEEDLNLDVGASAFEFLQQLGSVMGSNFVDTLKSMMTPDESSVDEYIADENHFSPAPNRAPQFGNDSPNGGSLERSEQFERSPSTTHVKLRDCFQLPNDDGSVTSLEKEPEDADVDGVHIPPPLNMKRIEMYNDAYYDSIEAAEVPLDVIENKRPFQCGLAGCNKTFKNPQTMKMHHKTHFSDGSAGVSFGDPLSTLAGPNNNNGNNNNNAWMSGRNKKIPSRCPKCRKTFVGLYELRRHYGRKHSEGERPFQCRKCDKRFYIEVDVRDHEKLCGEQIECKCGLKFAFKCNMVAHKKAHPACKDAATPPTTRTTTTTTSTTTHPPPPPPTTTTTSTSVTINPGYSSYNNNNNNNSAGVVVSNKSSSYQSGYQATISNEDSSISRWITLQPPGSTLKRCHELVEATRPDLMSKRVKVYSRRAAPASFRAAEYDFAGLGFSTDGGGSLWPSNMHYPSVPLPGPVPGPVSSVTAFSSLLGGLEHLGSSSRPQEMPYCNNNWPGRFSALELLQLAGVTPGL